MLLPPHAITSATSHVRPIGGGRYIIRRAGIQTNRWTTRGHARARSLARSAPFAFAGGKPPELWSGTQVAKPERGSVVVDGRHIRLRNRAIPRELVLSHADDNDQWAALPEQHDADFQ